MGRLAHHNKHGCGGVFEDRTLEGDENDPFAESWNDSSFKNPARHGDTRTRFKALFNEACQVLDYKKDANSDSKFELLLSNFISEQRAEIHQKNNFLHGEPAKTVSILTEKETCNRARVYNTKNYF